MPVPKDVATWQPIARKLLLKKDQQQLPLKKVVRRLCRRGAKRFGLRESDEGLQKAVYAFIDVARLTGSLEFKGNFVALPKAHADCTVTGQDGTASRRADTSTAPGRSKPAVKVLAPSKGPVKAQHQRDIPSKKRKLSAALGSSTVLADAAEKPQTPAPLQAVARESLSKGKPEQPAGEGTEQSADELPTAQKRRSRKQINKLASKDLTGITEQPTKSLPGELLAQAAESKITDIQQCADEHLPAKRKRKPLSEDLTGSTADVNNADSSTAEAKHDVEQPLLAKKIKSKKKKKRQSLSGEHTNGIAGVSYADNAGLQQSAVEVMPSKKRKAGKIVKDLSSEIEVAGKQKYADEAPPVQKGRSMNGGRVPMSLNLTSGTAGVQNADIDTAGAQQNADEPPPARKRKSKKKGSASLSKDDTDEVNNSDSMPGIPGSSNAEMTWKQLDKRTDVKRGRFSQSEKETLVEAIKDFARANNLSDSNLSWIYNTKNNLGNNLTAEDRAQRKGAWLAIAQSLPHRTPKSVYAFATRVLHEGNYLGKWSIEDSKRLLHLYAEKGNKWAEIGAALGRHPENTRYKFRELALGEAAVKGKWTPEDEAKLTELVTQYIEERPEPDIKNGRILIDAVNWDIISQQMGTRAPKACRQKWYDSLAPSMVSRGDWGIGDDRRLLKALFRAGYSREWQVDWGNVVSERTALAAKRRWRLMLKSVPDYQEKEFADVVDELVSAHLPALKQKAAQGTIADPHNQHTAQASDQPLKDTTADECASE